LSSGLQALQAANPGVDIMEFDTFNLFDQVADNPAGFGFDNVANRCLQANQTLDPACDPGRWFFWDDIHATTAAHGLMARAMFEQVYEVPAPLPVAGAAVAFGWARRLRRRLRR
ncbi:MAG: hypothetical protein VKN13_05060, partial [Cyanobacteriota bacterium]|nr:hypothetical protein [Cyanobacteriota bacterium]